MKISFLNPSIFQKFFSFAIKRNTPLCFDRIFSSSFYFIEKRETKYNFPLKKYKLEFMIDSSPKVSSSFDLKFTYNFFFKKFNCAKYEQLLVFDKFNDLLQTKSNKRNKEKFQKMITNKEVVRNFRKLFNYKKKKNFHLNMSQKVFINYFSVNILFSIQIS